MATLGSDCNGSGIIIYANGLVIEEFNSSPVNVIEQYLGEPYITYADAGILGGRQAYTPQFRRGDGTVVRTDAPRDSQVYGVIIAPTSESDTWKLNVSACNYWDGSNWQPYGGGAIVGCGIIARYAYSFNL